MTDRLIIAPEYASTDGPVVFLAGPIQGTHDWQTDAIEILQRLAPDIHIASPRRPANHYRKGNFSPELYAEQVDWESSYLRRAAQNGCVLFWLAKESTHDCTRAYAQTTRFELAEWKVHHESKGTPLALGIEEGYTGAKYVRRRFSQDCSDIVIRSSLEETCADAIHLARRTQV